MKYLCSNSEHPNPIPINSIPVGLVMRQSSGATSVFIRLVNEGGVKASSCLHADGALQGRHQLADVTGGLSFCWPFL